MKRHGPLLIAAIAAAFVLLAGGSWLLFKKSAEPQPADAGVAKPVLTVETVQAQKGMVPLTLSANGNVAAWQDVIVGSQSNGLRLAEIRANVGDVVKKGQVLAVFAADLVDTDVLQARAALLEAQAQAADAQSNAERARRIADTGALSTQQINQFNTAAQAGAARVEAARAVLASQQLRQSHTQVMAPDGGVISSRSATLGAVVPAGMELFRMVRQGRLEWRAEVVDKDLPRLHVGDAVTVTIAGGTLQGRVRSLAPTLDAQKRVALVYVDLPDAQARGARAGMYASGVFHLGQAEGWLVPQSSVVAREGFDYVFTVTPQGKALQRRVQTGARLGEQVQIVQGVDAQMSLVRSGAAFLNDGDTVRVLTVSAAVRP